jgi:hypothetical protein
MTIAQAIGRSADCGARLGSCFRADARLLLRAIGWRTALPVLKRSVSLRTLARWMHRSPVTRSQADGSLRRARLNTVRYFLAHGGRLVISENCLERSLTLYRFLAEVGADPQLVMGVRRDDSGTDGHVWIEVDGEPFVDSTTTGYTRVLAFGAGGGVVAQAVQSEHV